MLAVDLAVDALVLFNLAELLDKGGEAWLIVAAAAVIDVEAPFLLLGLVFELITTFLLWGLLSFFSSSAILSMKLLGGGTGTSLLNGLTPDGLTAVRDYCYYWDSDDWFKGWILGGLNRLSLDMAPPFKFKLPAP